MKKQIISGFSLLFLAALLAVGYQNCGDVGGISPLSGTDPGVDEGTNALSGEFLALRFTSNPSIVNDRVLVANFDCDYRPFNYNSHYVHITVSGVGYNYSANLTTNCAGSTFTHQRTLPINTNGITFDSTKAHTVHAQVFGIQGAEIINGDGKSIATANIAQGMIFPASTDVVNHSFESLAEPGQNHRDIVVYQGLPANSYPLTSLRGQIEFKLTSMLAVNTVSSLFEIIPYEIQGNPLREYFLQVMRTGSGDNDRHTFIQGFPGYSHPVPTAQNFVIGKTYVVNFTLYYTGAMALTIVDKANPSNIAYGGYSGQLDNFYASDFSKTPMRIRLGKSVGDQTIVHNGFSNIKVKYRVCGYVNQTPDTACASDPL